MCIFFIGQPILPIYFFIFLRNPRGSTASSFFKLSAWRTIASHHLQKLSAAFLPLCFLDTISIYRRNIKGYARLTGGKSQANLEYSTLNNAEASRAREILSLLGICIRYIWICWFAEAAKRILRIDKTEKRQR